MKRFQKWLALCLCLALFTGVVTSCSRNKDRDSSSSNSSSSSSSEDPGGSGGDDTPIDVGNVDGDGDPVDYPDGNDLDFDADRDSNKDKESGFVFEDDEEDDTLPEVIKDINDYNLIDQGAQKLRLSVQSDPGKGSNQLRVVFSEKGKGQFVFKDTDFLEYDVYTVGNPLGVGMIDIEVANGASALATGKYAFDMEGQKAEAGVTLGALAANQWYHRKVRIPEELVGKSVFRWSMMQKNNIQGQTTITYFDNIKITDGRDKTRFAVDLYDGSLLNNIAMGEGIKNASLKVTKQAPDVLAPQGDFLRFVVENRDLDKNQSSYMAYMFSDTGRASYKLKKGDTLVYKVRSNDSFIKGSGSVDVRLTDNTWLSDIKGLTDSNGLSVNPSADLNAYAGGQWYYRSIKIPDSAVGKTVNYFTFKALNNISGAEYEVHIADVKIINGSKTNLLVYGGGKMKNCGLIAARNATMSVSRIQSCNDKPAPSGDYLRASLYSYSVEKVSASARISSEKYVIQPGDCLEYDITSYDSSLHNSGFAVELTTTDKQNIRFSGWRDQNAISGSPGLDINAYTAGKWYHRKVNLGNSNGATVDGWLVSAELASKESIGVNGRYYNFGVDNIRITNNGKVIKTIYKDGAPAEVTVTNRVNNEMYTVSSTPYKVPTPIYKVPAMTLAAADYPVIAYNVKDFGAKADGKTDDTNAIQGAIHAAKLIGGGLVFLPAGRYVIKGTLYLPNTVQLRGEWQSPLAGGSGKGTILMAYAGKGSEEGYNFINIDSDASISHLSVWYPEQNAASPQPYPWTIHSPYGQSAAKNITLYNSWRGVKFGNGSNGTNMYENIFGTVLKTGMEIDCNFDTPRLMNVTFTPAIWGNSTLSGAPSGQSMDKLKAFLVANLEGLRAGRIDNIVTYGWTVDYAKIGIHYALANIIEPNTITDGGVWANGSEFYLTNVNTGFFVEGAAGIGVMMSGGKIVANQGSDPAAIRTTGHFDSNASFHSMELSSTASAVKATVNGSVSLQNCKITNWGASSAAVEVTGGLMVVSGCRFDKAQKHINVTAGAKSITVQANTFTGSPNVTVASGVKQAVNHTATTLAQLGDAVRHDFRSQPKAGTNKVFLVTAYGAKADKVTDDTAAIQKAIDAAAAAGGGIVYFPAGQYCIRGYLTVKSKVELRGAQDAQHHTKFGHASVLNIYVGKGDVNGRAAIDLNANAGVNGLDFFYPETYGWNVKPFSYTIRSTGGEGVYAVNCSFVNAYQGVDFYTNNSDKHYISSIGGHFNKQGVAVGKAPTYGTVQYVQMVIHYWTGYRSFGAVPEPPNVFEDTVFQYASAHTNAFLFGDCGNESLLGIFNWSANTGHIYKDQGAGGFKGKFIIMGIDGPYYSMIVEKAREIIVSSSELWCHGLTQYTPSRHYLWAKPGNNAVIRLFNVGGGSSSYPYDGFYIEDGDITVQQFNFAASSAKTNVVVRGGTVNLQSIVTWPVTTAYPPATPTDIIQYGGTLNVIGWTNINRAYGDSLTGTHTIRGQLDVTK